MVCRPWLCCRGGACPSSKPKKQAVHLLLPVCCAAAPFSKTPCPNGASLRHGTCWSWHRCLCSHGDTHLQVSMVQQPLQLVYWLHNTPCNTCRHLPRPAGRRPEPHLQCTAVLTSNKLAAGILLPVLLALRLQRKSTWLGADGVNPVPQPEPVDEQHAQQRAERGRRQPSRFNLAADVQACGQRADAALQSGCMQLGRHPAAACLAAWVVLGNLWVASTALTQLGLSL